MPRKPWRIRPVTPTISEALRAYFETGETGTDLDLFILDGAPYAERRRAWLAVKAAILRDWSAAHPCTRPWAWWEHDAPRWTRTFGAWFDGTLPEPRQRLGGIGTPAYEVLFYVPYLHLGIPCSWVRKWQEDFYNGRMRDIHGTLRNAKWPPGSGHYQEGDFPGVAIDPADPPRFESEAAYLERHGLLTPAELAHLAEHPELLTPETVPGDDGEDGAAVWPTDAERRRMAMNEAAERAGNPHGRAWRG